MTIAFFHDHKCHIADSNVLSRACAIFVHDNTGAVHELNVHLRVSEYLYIFDEAWLTVAGSSLVGHFLNQQVFPLLPVPYHSAVSPSQELL